MSDQPWVDAHAGQPGIRAAGTTESAVPPPDRAGRLRCNREMADLLPALDRIADRLRATLKDADDGVYWEPEGTDILQAALGACQLIDTAFRQYNPDEDAD